MPRIEHIAIWCKDLEVMKNFYVEYFQGTAGKKYHNPKKGFTSYFLFFENGSRLELMHREDIHEKVSTNSFGWAHLAFSEGSKKTVDQLTSSLQGDGFEVMGQPRTTGDGYYESTVLDPEGNQVEITA